jgi:succinate dehydrogenase hydrophobic anchor subunit
MLNKLDDFWFKYFSIATLNSSDGWVRKAVGGVMLVPFLISFAFVIADNMPVAQTIGLIYGAILLVFAIVWVFVFFYHKWRIKHGK